MKCKLHPYHTGDGVCGACLHDRLLPLVSSSEHSPNRKSDSSSSTPTLSPSSQSAPARFPQSVSPYFTASIQKTKTHFFRTPQAVPSATCSTEKVRRGRKGKFSFLYSLFGHSTKDKVKSNSSSSWWMQRFMRRGKRKCHVDNVEPIQRCSARAAKPAGINLSWKLADTASGYIYNSSLS